MENAEQLRKQIQEFEDRARERAERFKRHSWLRNYGWVRDLPDHRDLMFSAALTALPPKADVRASIDVTKWPVYDQGQLGSCTANAIAGALEFDEIKEGKPSPFIPSRLFIYYCERVIEGTVNSDGGAQIRDGVKVVAKIGVPPESDWPYDISKFEQKPPVPAYQDATRERVSNYMRVPQVAVQLRACLASGYPFVFGFTVYESFESQQVAQTGVMPMPQPQEAVVGGHAVCAVGYDDSQNVVIVRNSWGAAWGRQGYFLMPYAYILDQHLASDFWTMRTIP